MLRSAVRGASGSLDAVPARLQLNGRTYDLPRRAVAVVCLDGCEDDYLTVAMAHGKMPNLQRFYRAGFRGLARSALPSFTNPNNVSIVCGVAPDVHGISGNYFYDMETGEEVMMNQRRFMRSGTLLKAAEEAGRKVA
eukprot:6025533-Amphidinium_carterae.1